jgi:hypothetical protein
MSLLVVKSIEFDDLSDLLWSGARDRWDRATDDQRKRVWDAIIDIFCDNADKYPSMTEINDFIWFECDDYLRDDDEDNSIDSYEDEMKHEDDPSCDDWR